MEPAQRERYHINILSWSAAVTIIGSLMLLLFTFITSLYQLDHAVKLRTIEEDRANLAEFNSVVSQRRVAAANYFYSMDRGIDAHEILMRKEVYENLYIQSAPQLLIAQSTVRRVLGEPVRDNRMREELSRQLSADPEQFLDVRLNRLWNTLREMDDLVVEQYNCLTLENPSWLSGQDYRREPLSPARRAELWDRYHCTQIPAAAVPPATAPSPSATPTAAPASRSDRFYALSRLSLICSSQFTNTITQVRDGQRYSVTAFLREPVDWEELYCNIDRYCPANPSTFTRVQINDLQDRQHTNEPCELPG
jgi:hypothetical protein